MIFTVCTQVFFRLLYMILSSYFFRNFLIKKDIKVMYILWKKIMIMIFSNICAWFFFLTLSEKLWKSKMTKSCINGEKRVTYIGSKIMYIGHWSLFMTPPKNRKYLCHPVLSHPRNFYATPQFWNVYATHFYTTLNISVFQRKIRN